MLTFFTCPKGFAHEHTGLIQRNAIRSWTAAEPGARVILFGDDPGVAETAADLGVDHCPDVGRNEFGTPLLSDMFAQANELADTPHLCFVNADIVLLPDIVDAATTCAATGRAFLMVGQRHTLDIREALVFPDCWAGLRESAARTPPDPAMALDYFCYPRGLFREIPAFAIGRVRWDNWMLWAARERGADLVNATAAVTAVHQRHDYGHLAAGAAGSRSGPEADRNLELAGGWTHIYNLGDATHELRDGAVRAVPWLSSCKRRGFRLLQRLKHRLVPGRGDHS